MNSIRNRIIVFALLATLLPSGASLWLAYSQSRRSLEDTTRQELVNKSGQAAGAVNVWLKERFYDLRVFAASQEVSDNLESAARAGAASPNRGRLNDYLVSLHERSPDFAQLLVLDLQGRVVASSAAQAATVSLPQDWVERLRRDEKVIGAASWDAQARTGRVLVAVPANRADGRPLGAFAAELKFAPLEKELLAFARDSAGMLLLVAADGTPLVSAHDMSADLMAMKLPAATLQQLQGNKNTVTEYKSVTGESVVGALEPVAQADWFIVAEIPEEVAFGKVRQFRNIGLLLVLVLLAAVTASAYRFGRIIARPLERLTKGATEVAAGNLTVDLPAAGAGEVRDLTDVFNGMVARLRESREEVDAVTEALRERNDELARLSVTDGLTGLWNRRFLGQRLAEEMARSRRAKQPFTVLMADVDKFKQYNDTHGHPAGDEVLKAVAAVLRDSVRTTDFVARFGGEEFCVMLSGASAAEALPLAEKMRKRIEETVVPGGPVTLSIGLAAVPDDAENPEGVVAAADEALYAAKRAGRNRVVRWTKSENEKLTIA